MNTDAEDNGIRAGDVQPGMTVWNPYGGRAGRFTAAAEPRTRADGVLEIDATDGRTGLFRPSTRLYLVRHASADRVAEAGPEAGS